MKNKIPLSEWEPGDKVKGTSGRIFTIEKKPFLKDGAFWVKLMFCNEPYLCRYLKFYKKFNPKPEVSLFMSKTQAEIVLTVIQNTEESWLDLGENASEIMHNIAFDIKKQIGDL